MDEGNFSLVLLAVQRGLWNMVTPGLRSVSVGLDTDSCVLVRFSYDCDLVGGEAELPNEVVAEVAGDLPEYDVDALVEVAPFGSLRMLRDGERWVYLRREVEVE